MSEEFDYPISFTQFPDCYLFYCVDRHPQLTERSSLFLELHDWATNCFIIGHIPFVIKRNQSIPYTIGGLFQEKWKRRFDWNHGYLIDGVREEQHLYSICFKSEKDGKAYSNKVLGAI